jgi:hypothetical protein
MSDGELQELHGDAADLTESAQATLRAEMGRRGLTAAAVEAEPAALAWAGEAAVAAGDSGDSPEVLQVFHQTFEAERAFAVLEREEIAFEVKDFSVDEKGEPRPGPAIQLGLLVPRGLRARAIRVLHRDAGLFPQAEETTGEAEDEMGDDGEMFPVGQFEGEAEAEIAEQLLRGAGIVSRRATPEDGEDAEGSGPVIEVRPEDLERAAAVLEQMVDGDLAEGAGPSAE